MLCFKTLSKSRHCLRPLPLLLHFGTGPFDNRPKYDHPFNIDKKYKFESIPKNSGDANTHIKLPNNQ